MVCDVILDVLDQGAAGNKCCGSKDITQIRRVSGYLGYLSQFSHGKALEQKRRVKHTQIEVKEK